MQFMDVEHTGADPRVIWRVLSASLSPPCSPRPGRSFLPARSSGGKDNQIDRGADDRPNLTHLPPAAMPTPYRRLQSRAKQAGIPANQSARELERQLAATTPRFATSTPQPNLDDPDDDEVPPPTTSDDAGGRHGWAALRTRAAIDFRGFSGDEAYDADDADAPADPLNMSDMAREAVKQFRKGGQIAMLRRKQTRYCCNHVVPAASETPLTERCVLPPPQPLILIAVW